MDINKLHPAIREIVKQFAQECAKQGYPILIYMGARTIEEQNKLFNQPYDGIDNDKDGKVDESDEKVTNARGGESWHNYGLAIDVVPLIGGKAAWDRKDIYEEIGTIGESLGFEWGGRWKFVDRPHFQFPRGMNLKTLKALKHDKDGFVILPPHTV